MNNTLPDLESIFNYVSQVLIDLASDWDIGPIQAETNLGSLGMESLDLVYMIADLQRHYGLQHRLIKRLTDEKIELMALRVVDIVRFISELCSISNPEEIKP